MARPKKYKRVCMMPRTNTFSPAGKQMGPSEPLIMTVVEYETIRLIDYEGLSQEECAEIMSVARATIQRIYADARKKIAQFFIEGKILKIEGGNYQICNEDYGFCGCCKCPKRSLINQILNSKGDKNE
jgi:predicted DNA-binding protein (UPF0251 family)